MPGEWWQEPVTVPVPAPAPQVTLESISEMLNSLTVTVVCHPDDLELLQAAADANTTPIQVLPSPAVPRGTMIGWQGKHLPLTPTPRRRRDDHR